VNTLEVSKTYSQQIIDGIIPANDDVILSCKRFLQALQNPEFYYDEEEVKTLVEFCQEFYLTEVSPPTLTVLQPFQIWLLANIYGIKYKDTQRRVCKIANVSVARGNAKTQLVCLLCIFELLYGVDAQIVIAGNTVKTSMEVDYDKIKKLLEQIDPTFKHIQKYYNKFVYNNNRIIVTSNESKGFDGMSASIALCDEMHLFEKNNVYGALRSSLAKRKDSVMIIASTAGLNADTEYYKLCQYSKRVLRGEIDDPTHFAALFSINENDIYNLDLFDNEKYIRMANPMIGVSVEMRDIKRELQTAKNSEADRVSILTKHLNIFHKNKTDNFYIHDKYIQKAFDRTIKLTDIPEDVPLFLGLDLSKNDDITALAVCCMHNNYYNFFNYYYIPEDSLSTNKNRERYKEAQKDGYIKIQKGAAIDYEDIVNDIKNIAESHYVKLIAYDPYKAKDLVNKLKSRFNLLPFSQLGSNMNNPLTEMQRIFLLNQVKLQFNPITEWMFSNVEVKTSSMGLLTIDKSNSESNKVDGVSAMADAIGGMLAYPTLEVGIS
jgi:phage terminase large subunit-like protein